MSAKTASTKSTKSTASVPVAEPVVVATPAKKAAAAPAKKAAEPVKVAEPVSAAKTPRGKKAASSTDSALVSQLAASAVASVPEGGEKVRRVVNNEEIEKSFDELHASIETELQALRDDKNHSVGIRFLRSVARQIKSIKAAAFRLLSRKVRKPSTRNGNSGFMKSVKISPEMAKFCGFKADLLVSRVDVTKSICNYVKENKLQNEADRRQFTPDAKLATLLGVTETITYYTLQKHIQKHFPKTVVA